MKDCQNKVTRLINKLSKPKGTIDGKLREIQGKVSGSQAKLPFYFSPHSLFSLSFFKQTTPPKQNTLRCSKKNPKGKNRKAKVVNLLSIFSFFFSRLFRSLRSPTSLPCFHGFYSRVEKLPQLLAS